ncbi:MAG TPA: steroid 5-alpha reductase, partial [Clostridiaceae bacterium]|nr:steroid 5-alpha reductase [Clostridiaceae bacterium]
MNPYIGTAVMLLVFFTLLFFLGQILKNNAIVDSFWGPSFLLIALFTLVTAENPGLRQNLLTGLVALWSLRLFYYITLRNWN